MDIVLILLLILLNGVFAMSEIAVVSSRKSRLQNLADDGSLGAEAALSLHQEPSSFLSTVVVGELVPKRLALLAPEGIASLMARPMMILARVTHPLVVVLSGSCSMILRLLGARRKDEPPVTDDEIKVLMEQGAEAGVFHESEQEIVSNVLRLDEQRSATCS